ncbi:histidine kinase [Heyndrickxia shackletonii]|uniref:histidine kinase n=1 Tax=Heyndrickxia shackletonii TaxID=157838 RepID=A0A0Q3WWZ5_9BACI|nr:ATP-binding protein [Heyndrickxia shackletonii]KQL53930.1 histidine kinase [Heyndrickxia shackletonii]MBB2478903.1 HAMP domain-containing histidine kinase [Bacillus sp. APMAM]NEY97786.1 HAMP domain-containing histidine kinase [Heyndrickxia shackletonii]RTZ57650.1 HAMP domain-containing histidine kinase [Bacillus sp. SAJ1]
MMLTVRQKIFISMGLLVLIIGGVHALTKQAYMASLFDQFRKEEIDASYLNAMPGEQIEILKTYVSDKMQNFLLGNWVFFIATGLLFSLWISGLLTIPLRKLVAAIERVAQGDLDVNVPVQSKDEYGKVIRTFNEMTLRLREAEEARRRLVADVAHELRTPLSIMQLKLENAQQSGQYIPPEMLLRLHDEVIRLGLLVEDLHVLSLAEAGRLVLDCKPLDLSARLEQIVDDVKMEAEENGLELHFYTNKRSVTVMADARRITQVFINLLTNAIRYTPVGGKISVVMEDNVLDKNTVYTCVSVIDTGIGIPAEELAHLFDRFYRVEKARSRHTGGTGLGLSISHHFVRAHGGFIRVKSEPDQGTTFTVYLPLGKC